jgi:ribosomal RNA methyltransferase Nop2
MGINGQKRKKKQGPVPTLEESLPKKFKPDARKPKKLDSTKNGAKVNRKEKREWKVNKVHEESVEEFEGKPGHFGTTKALLFDDEDEEEPIGDFGTGGDEPMYSPTTHSPPNCRDGEFDTEDEEGGENVFSGSEDEEELTAANMEALSAKLDTFAREDILAAQDELLNPDEPPAEGVLKTAKEGGEELSSVKTRIVEIVRVLGDFKALREEGVKRKEYIERLVEDVAAYYSYNTYLARKFLQMFSVPEVEPAMFRSLSNGHSGNRIL